MRVTEVCFLVSVAIKKYKIGTVKFGPLFYINLILYLKVFTEGGGFEVKICPRGL